MVYYLYIGQAITQSLKRENEMENIQIKVNHSFQKRVQETGENEWNVGNTSLEIDTRSDGLLSFHIENRGFGSKTAKKARVFLGEEDAIAIINYLKKYLEIKEKLDAIKNINSDQ